MSDRSAPSTPASGAKVLRAEDRLAIAKPLAARLERAYKHLDDLHVEIGKFLNEDPNFMVVYNDDIEEAGKRRVDVVNTGDTTTIALIAGDAIHNLRSALNYLYVSLARHAPRRRDGTPEFSDGALHQIQFPAPKTPEIYRRSEARGQIERMGQDILKMFDALYADDRACKTLWRLNALSNTDKHRTLVGVGTKGHGWRAVKHVAPPPVAPTGNEGPAETIKAALALPFPLPKHTVIAGIPDADAGDDMHVTFEVAFNQSGIEGEPVIETLDDMFYLAHAVISAFVPLP